MVKFVKLLQPPEPCENLRKEASYGTKQLGVSECAGQILSTSVPEGLVVLHPSPEGWLCRNKQPAAGSTLPRQRCSLAVLQAGRLLLLLLRWPEELLDLEDKQEEPVLNGFKLKHIQSQKPEDYWQLFIINESWF